MKMPNFAGYSQRLAAPAPATATVATSQMHQNGSSGPRKIGQTTKQCRSSRTQRSTKCAQSLLVIVTLYLLIASIGVSGQPWPIRVFDSHESGRALADYQSSQFLNNHFYSSAPAQQANVGNLQSLSPLSYSASSWPSNLNKQQVAGPDLSVTTASVLPTVPVPEQLVRLSPSSADQSKEPASQQASSETETSPTIIPSTTTTTKAPDSAKAYHSNQEARDVSGTSAGSTAAAAVVGSSSSSKQEERHKPTESSQLSIAGRILESSGNGDKNKQHSSDNNLSLNGAESNAKQQTEGQQKQPQPQLQQQQQQQQAKLQQQSSRPNGVFQSLKPRRGPAALSDGQKTEVAVEQIVNQHARAQNNHQTRGQNEPQSGLLYTTESRPGILSRLLSNFYGGADRPQHIYNDDSDSRQLSPMVLRLGDSLKSMGSTISSRSSIVKAAITDNKLSRALNSVSKSFASNKFVAGAGAAAALAALGLTVSKLAGPYFYSSFKLNSDPLLTSNSYNMPTTYSPFQQIHQERNFAASSLPVFDTRHHAPQSEASGQVDGPFDVLYTSASHDSGSDMEEPNTFVDQNEQSGQFLGLPYHGPYHPHSVGNYISGQPMSNSIPGYSSGLETQQRPDMSRPNRGRGGASLIEGQHQTIGDISASSSDLMLPSASLGSPIVHQGNTANIYAMRSPSRQPEVSRSPQVVAIKLDEPTRLRLQQQLNLMQQQKMRNELRSSYNIRPRSIAPLANPTKQLSPPIQFISPLTQNTDAKFDYSSAGYDSPTQWRPTQNNVKEISSAQSNHVPKQEKWIAASYEPLNARPSVSNSDSFDSKRGEQATESDFAQETAIDQSKPATAAYLIIAPKANNSFVPIGSNGASSAKPDTERVGVASQERRLSSKAETQSAGGWRSIPSPNNNDQTTLLNPNTVKSSNAFEDIDSIKPQTSTNSDYIQAGHPLPQVQANPVASVEQQQTDMAQTSSSNEN